MEENSKIKKGALRSAHLLCGHGWPPKIRPFPYALPCRNWSLGQGTSVIKEIRLKNLTTGACLSRSLKVIGNRQGSKCNLCLLIKVPLQPWGLSRLVSETNDFNGKSQICLTPVFNAPAEEVPLGTPEGLKKLEWWS